MLRIVKSKEAKMTMGEMNRFSPHLPFGPQTGFIFHLDYLYFKEMEDSFYPLTGTDSEEWQHKSVFYIIDRLASPSHLRGTHSLFGKGIEALKRSKDPDISFNLEFNINDDRKGSRRFLLQCRKLEPTSLSTEPEGLGRLTDIHHMYNTGSPCLTIIQNNTVEKLIAAELQDETTSPPIDLSARELEVIKLKSKGFSTREIAAALNRSTLTIYSVVRDVKNKTGMELIPLIKSLIEKGLLD